MTQGRSREAQCTKEPTAIVADEEFLFRGALSDRPPSLEP